MTFKDVAELIDDIGYPSAYYQFDEDTAEAPPFICFFFASDNDVKADNSNYQKIERLIIELYTDDKDFDAEAAVESALNNAGLVYSREETHIDTEKLYEVIYTSSVVITQEIESE